MTTRDIGTQWENAALRHMRAAGLTLLARNFHCRLGEIDLVLDDGGQIVFAEVRYRGTGAHGGGAASVGATKQKKLVRAAQLWLQSQPRSAARPCRFDVIGCAGTPDRPTFDWVKSAFDAFTD